MTIDDRSSGHGRPASQWLIYGATGYTGELIAREAVRRGHKPVLAGRNREAIETLADELACESRPFALEAIDLSGIGLVLHCAGPFIHTSRPMVDACLEAGAHYLDITGEIAVFESIFARDAEARARGVVLLPGTGFDVVPTDCLASMLASRMPDAAELWLAFDSRGGISRGTLKTMIEGAQSGGAIRSKGRIKAVPHFWDVQEIPFESGTRTAVTIPWGDIASAFRTTRIPNIRVYMSRSPRAIRSGRRTAKLLPMLRLGPVRKLLLRLADRQQGPSAEVRATARVELWGRVANDRGEELTMTLSVAEGYRFTVLSALAAVERILAAPAISGALTPALAFGPDFVKEIEGTRAGE
ncbi:MAG TPA: saccharopine dehydrogenase NADP-binding domain-containing protein [Thermoanaerobaculia bacterium]